MFSMALLEGTKLCSCGADGIIRLFQLANKSEIASRESVDIFRYVFYTFTVQTVISHFSAMTWSSCDDTILFGTESGKLHVWDGASLSSLGSSKGHSGQWI